MRMGDTTRWIGLAAVLLLLGTGAVSQAASDTTVLQGDRQVMGTVEEIKGDQIKVFTGEVQARFIPMKQAREKGLTEVKEGDKLEITVNDQNLIVDFHLIGESGRPRDSAEHRVVKGQVAKPMAVGHDRAMIRTETGKQESYEIRSQARSKVASIPVGVDVVFLLDETNKIVDVTFTSKEEADRASKMPEKKSPPKGTSPH
jgi:hypothetical protein